MSYRVIFYSFATGKTRFSAEKRDFWSKTTQFSERKKRFSSNKGCFQLELAEPVILDRIGSALPARKVSTRLNPSAQRALFSTSQSW